jgi:PD-(D/E)XK nuclease superfamily protein
MLQMVTTDRHGSPVKKPFFWSWSRLQAYETCPKQFYHQDIVKDVVRGSSPEQDWGNQVHAALAKRIMNAEPLPAGMQHYEHWADKVMQGWDRTKVVVNCEQKLAITPGFQPCDYFDKHKPVWLRIVADVLKRADDVALLVDWKTGKRKDDLEQLLVSAAVVFAHYPEVQAIRSEFVWLQEDVTTSARVRRTDLPQVWQRMLPRVSRMEKALDLTEFPANPSGLCKRHCRVKSCPHYGVGSL